LRGHFHSILLGVVRGHFDLEERMAVGYDQLGNKPSTINMGIALVTPIEDLERILLREDVLADRRREETRYLDQHPKF
jgi:hypothetical protein